jgi:antirestriction protein ArdC
LRIGGEAYRGVNVIMLWMEAAARGFASPTWMTYRQAKELGGQVRKGETGALVVYADKITRTETNAATGQEELTAIPFMKGYTVFNCEQIDGLPDRFRAGRGILRRQRGHHSPWRE